MNSALIIIIVILILVVGVLLVNKNTRNMLKVKVNGRADSIMEQDATTPEGARDYYNAAIREQENLYSQASATYAEICGKLDAAEKELYDSNKEIMKITKEINLCLDRNDEDGAVRFAMKKETLQQKIEILKNSINELKASKEHREEIRNDALRQLEELKNEKEVTLFQLEADQQTIQLQQSMDSNNVNNETDRMLERVREGARQTRERAAGSRIAYDSSAEVQERRLENANRERNARQMVEDMKRQRGQ